VFDIEWKSKTTEKYKKFKNPHPLGKMCVKIDVVFCKFSIEIFNLIFQGNNTIEQVLNILFALKLQPHQNPCSIINVYLTKIDENVLTEMLNKTNYCQF